MTTKRTRMKMTTNKHESADRYVRYARHIRALCRAFGVRLRIERGMNPTAAGAGFATIAGVKTMTPAIIIAPVIDETTYAVALHELGHCLSPTGMLHDQGSRGWRKTNQLMCKRDVRLKMLEEQSAWEWAHHYALEWTDAMTFVEQLSLNSYKQQLNRLLKGRP